GWGRPEIPPPPFRAEREGPVAQRREGEVGVGERSGIPHLTPTLSAPRGGEGVKGGRGSVIAGPELPPSGRRATRRTSRRAMRRGRAAAGRQSGWRARRLLPRGSFGQRASGLAQ